VAENGVAHRVEILLEIAANRRAPGPGHAENPAPIPENPQVRDPPAEGGERDH
jgi:hypothetical protein